MRNFKAFVFGIVFMVVLSGVANGQTIWNLEILESVPSAAIMNVPDGSGDSLDSAFNIDQSGNTIDASITIKVTFYPSGNPVTSIIGSHLYLYKQIPPYVKNCGYQSPSQTTIIVDHLFESMTSSNGEYRINGSLELGGYSSGGYLLQFYNPYHISGYGRTFGITSYEMISPDLNGDGIVNLADNTIFASIYFGEYDPKADFFYDGEMSLADFSRYSAANGTSCP